MAIAQGFHLFPFRTEKLSLVTPMVLRNSGRVGSRRFWWKPPSQSNDSEAFFVCLYWFAYTLLNCIFWVNVKTWGIHSLCINFSKSEQKESSVLHSSELCAELLNFGIEWFRSGISGASVKEVDYFPVMCLHGTYHSSESQETWFRVNVKNWWIHCLRINFMQSKGKTI